MIPQEKIESFVRILLEWAKDSTGDFPWRRTKDAYKILVAEIILQRTKAEQVAQSTNDLRARAQRKRKS